MRTYHTLLVRDGLDDAWGVHFGDYDYDTVYEERGELLNGGVLRSHVLIIHTTDAQADIDAAVDRINAEGF